MQIFTIFRQAIFARFIYIIYIITSICVVGIPCKMTGFLSHYLLIYPNQWITTWAIIPITMAITIQSSFETMPETNIPLFGGQTTVSTQSEFDPYSIQSNMITYGRVICYQSKIKSLQPVHPEQYLSREIHVFTSWLHIIFSLSWNNKLTLCVVRKKWSEAPGNVREKGRT